MIVKNVEKINETDCENEVWLEINDIPFEKESTSRIRAMYNKTDDFLTLNVKVMQYKGNWMDYNVRWIMRYFDPNKRYDIIVRDTWLENYEIAKRYAELIISDTNKHSDCLKNGSFNRSMFDKYSRRSKELEFSGLKMYEHDLKDGVPGCKKLIKHTKEMYNKATSIFDME